MGSSNKVTAVVNLGTMLCSIPIIGAGMWLASKPDNECVSLFRWPVLVLGVLVLLVSLAGFLGAYWHKDSLLAFSIFCMAILITLLLILLLFTFIVTLPDGEFRLDGFSGWLRDRITNWYNIHTCLADSHLCTDQFSAPHMSPLQSGCCKPPAACGYVYVNPTLWVNPVDLTAEQDCMMWSNEQRQLCYACDSCKAGLLGNLRQEWRTANFILFITLIVLISVYAISCTEGLFRRHK